MISDLGPLDCFCLYVNLTPLEEYRLTVLERFEGRMHKKVEKFGIHAEYQKIWYSKNKAIAKQLLSNCSVATKLNISPVLRVVEE